jgi:hypothetical protein
MERHILKQLGRFAGTSLLFIGSAFDEGRNFKKHKELQRIDQLWYAELLFFDLGKPMLVTCVAGQGWQKGLILIPRSRSYITDGPQKFLGAKTPYFVDLSEWHDPIHELLNQLNAFPSRIREDYGGLRATYRYKIVAYTAYSELMFNYQGMPTKNNDFLKLWLATLDVIHHLRKQYQDEEIDAFVENSLHYKKLMRELKDSPSSADY